MNAALKISVAAAKTPAAHVSDAVLERIRETLRVLSHHLTNVDNGLYSLRTIAKQLPLTSMSMEGMIAPEVVFPALATGSLEEVNQCYDCVELCQKLLSGEPVPEEEDKQ